MDTFAIRTLVLAGEVATAEAALAELIRIECDLDVAGLRIVTDAYSLNSLTATVDLTDGTTLFAKLHTEEGEDATIEEYYRAEVLARAGLPTDLPVHASTKPGRQVLLYRWRDDARMADEMLRIDDAAIPVAELSSLFARQGELDRLVGAAAVASLHAANSDDIAAEAVHQLFSHRLAPGGRFDRFYASDDRYRAIATARWIINGVEHRHTLAELFDESTRRLAPGALGPAAVISHGDAHDANVWVEPDRLVLFDPAFAGEHVPALLAEVKPTFHNVWAHPRWLYNPSTVTAEVSWSRRGAVIVLDHDLDIGPRRRARLTSTTDLVWRPLLAAMSDQGLLAVDWERTVRCALFCCPTLVMNQLAGRREAVSMLGLAIAVTAGSPGVAVSTEVDDWIASLR